MSIRECLASTQQASKGNLQGDMPATLDDIDTPPEVQSSTPAEIRARYVPYGQQWTDHSVTVQCQMRARTACDAGVAH
jgi:hypothetical protein